MKKCEKCSSSGGFTCVAALQRTFVNIIYVKIILKKNNILTITFLLKESNLIPSLCTFYLVNLHSSVKL